MNDLLRKIVSPKENYDDLYLVVGMQQDVDDQEEIAVIMNANLKTKFMNIKKIILRNDKTIKDVFDEASEDTLFCYRCLTHIKPKYVAAESIFYKDIDGEAIHSFLPHCPICKNEVYSKGYHTAAEDYINETSILRKYFQ
jgi:hypothetical protein